MLLIRPTPLTPAMVTASNAGAADAEYNPATSYGLGTRVFLSADGQTYECIQAPALDKYPPSSPLYWMLAAPSNRWAMWDAEISTATTVAGNLTATLLPGARVNAVSLHGLLGESVTVVQKSATNATLWSETRALLSNPSGWYSYYYEPRTQVRDAVFLGLVPSTGSRIEITLTGASTACSTVVAGNSLHIGDAQYGFTTGIVDYSRKDTSSAGVQTLRKGRYSKRMSGTLVQERGQYNAVSAALEAVRATPCVWVGVTDSADYEPMTILGFYRDFSIEVPYPTHNICSLDIEGLT